MAPYTLSPEIWDVLSIGREVVGSWIAPEDSELNKDLLSGSVYCKGNCNQFGKDVDENC